MSLNFFCALTVSREMPRTTMPAFLNWVKASRKPQDSMVQPGAVSYTHLDVYKRQPLGRTFLSEHCLRLEPFA